MDKQLELNKMIGKTIYRVIYKPRHSEHPIEGEGDLIELKFTDGTSMLMISKDSEDFSSWIDVKLKGGV